MDGMTEHEAVNLKNKRDVFCKQKLKHNNQHRYII